jgi:hypothetical protein
MPKLSLPQSWYKFDDALKSGAVTLVNDRSVLAKYLIFTYFASFTCFVGLCVYYSLLTTKDFVVSDEYDLAGHSCRPLQKDADYGLQITYDECVSQYFVSPTVENLISYGDYTPKVYDFSTQAETADGPWNFDDVSSGGQIFDHRTTTVYHKPFPKISNQTFTFSEECKLPYYKGFEETHPLYSGNSLDHPLEYATMEASINARHGYNGYGYYGLCNKDLQIVDSFPDGDKLIFEPNAPKTDFVTKCAGDGTFTDAMQTSLDSSGTHAFPHAYGNDWSIWIYDWVPETNIVTNVDDLSMRRRSIGITPLYPTNTFKPASEEDRCSFYEKEISRQAYEYIYSYENCSPCDSFKYNSPFYCERNVHKGAAEIIALASSNAMAAMSFFVAVAPLVLVKFVVKDEESSTT